MNRGRSAKHKNKKAKTGKPALWSSKQLPKANAPLVNQFHNPKTARIRPVCIVTRFNAEEIIIKTFKN